MFNRIDTRLTESINIKTPIIQAPLGGASTPNLIGAVADSGGLGTIPLGGYPLDKCKQMIDQTLQITDGIVGVNLILALDAPEKVELCLKKGIKIFWFFWGDPTRYIKTIHAHRGKVLLTVSCANQAKKALEAGVDVIVAQGFEAGGHILGKTAAMPLIPAVVDAVGGKIPVVCAGGIADGRGLAAALALGADGIVMGTRLLASDESDAHESYKKCIISAKETDTVYSYLFDKGWPGAPARTLKNSTYDNWLSAGKPETGSRPGEYDVITKLEPEGAIERYSISLPSSRMSGDVEQMAHYAGQSTGIIKDIKPVAKILNEVVSEAIATIKSCKSKCITA